MQRKGADLIAIGSKAMKYENWVFGKNGALLSACAQGDLELAQSLLNEGASPDVSSPNGFTALHRASEKGHIQIVTMLLEKGARASTTATDGSTPISAAICNGHNNIEEILKAYEK